MARYATAEKRFDCFRCHIICTVREMRNGASDWMFCCPNCDWMILFRPHSESPLLVGSGSVSEVYLADEL